MGLCGIVPADGDAAGVLHGEAVARAVDERIGNEARDGIHAKHENGHGPGATPLFDFEDPVEQSQEYEGEAAGEEDEGAGPKIFVDGEPDVPGLAGEQAENSSEQHDERFLFSGICGRGASVR